MFKKSDEIIKSIEKIMKIWRLQRSAGGKKLSRGENPERDLPGRCAITITICNSDDTTESHTEEMHRQI